MSFYMAPSSEKADLRADVFHHGGRFALTTEREMEGVIKMATEGATLPSGATDFFSINFIKDSTDKDKKLKLEDYRMSADAKGAFYSKVHLDYQDELTNEFDDLMPTLIAYNSKTMKGRKMYQVHEDKAIITYLVENRKLFKVNGNAVWKTMESLGITSHTWQSMKDHYIKYVQPNLRAFDLPPKVTKDLCRFYPALKTNPKDNEEPEIDDTSTDSDVISEVSATDETLLKAAGGAESDACSSSSNIVTGNGDHGSDLDPQTGTSAESRKNRNMPVKQTPPKKMSSLQAPVEENSNKNGPSLSDNVDAVKDSNKMSRRRKQRLVLRTDFDIGDGNDLPGLSGNDNKDKKKKTPVKLTPLKKTSKNQVRVQANSRKRRRILDDSNAATLSNISTAGNSSECDDFDDFDSPGGRVNAIKRARTLSPQVNQKSLNHKKISKYFVNVEKTPPSASATRSEIGLSSSECENEEMLPTGESDGPGEETGDSVTARESMGSGDESGGMETAKETMSSDSDASPMLKQAHVEETVEDEDEQGGSEEMDETFEEGELHLDSDESDDDDASDAGPMRLSQSEADEVLEGMESSFELDPERVKEILWSFSGNVGDAVSFLQGADLPFWTRQDDENLCSGENPESLDRFTCSQKKARLAFLRPVRKTYVNMS
ncbi:telomeric repeat-binding factor 2-interacting protein 1-like [Lineus longissimus]|uniref:telomeric repeat-binding factor 2-interacting protein 1-like n=1 Tax=Lineus longissimus TaxID=88925 RepID=UPI00315DC0D7